MQTQTDKRVRVGTQPRIPLRLARAALSWMALLAWSVANVAGADAPAYREDVITPHWRWEGRHEGGTVRALFLTPTMAVREPEELAQRFDISVETLGVKGQPPAHGLSLDQIRLAKLLEQEYDVIVIGSFFSNEIFAQISPENRKTLLDKVRAGSALVVSRGTGSWAAKRVRKAEGDAAPATPESGASPPTAPDDSRLILGEPDHDTAAPEHEDAATVARALPTPVVWSDREGRRIRGPGYRGGLSRVTLPLGKGRVVYVYGTAGHWTSFNLFLGQDEAYPMHGNPEAFFDDPVAPELFYAVASRWLRKAAGRESDVRVSVAVIDPDPVALGQTAQVKAQLVGAVADGDRLEWTLHDPYAEALESGVVELAAGQREIAMPLLASQAGLLTWRWQLMRGDVTLDYGATAWIVDAPASLLVTAPPAGLEAEAGMSLAWAVEGIGEPDDEVVAQVYDPDGRLVSMGVYAAAAGKGSLPAWKPRFVSHTLRLQHLRSGRCMTERRLPITTRLDRSDDEQEYQVAVWAMEGKLGSWQGRQRLPLLRDLGATALVGTGRALDRMAGEAGLRPVLCNIFPPSERDRPSHDADQAARRLAEIAATAAPHRPMGYMLADEPSPKMQDIVEYTRDAAAIIRDKDPGARVGWSGVWLGFEHDAPAFFKQADYVTAYSPHHLYNLNLWLGVERDLLRSFSRPDGMLTCWTHYAPWADSEPYSRTVPWLWLFEGMNGVSLFSSAGPFAVLPEDLRSTHESRWLGEEIKTLKQGIGRQLIGMERQTGAVRVLFVRHAVGTEDWMRALNRLNVPYRLASREELLAGLEPQVRLLICPSLVGLSDQELERLQAFARRGGVLVGVGSADGMETGAAQDGLRLENLFGVRRAASSAPAEGKLEVKPYAGITSHVSLSSSEFNDTNALELTGTTTGVHGMAPADGAETAGTFARLGNRSAGEETGGLEFIAQLFATPAVVAKPQGDGVAMYFAFRPDLDAMKLLIPVLMARSGAEGCLAQVALDGREDDTVYLYPFAGGGLRMVGVVQDYWRVDPDWEVRADGVPEDSAGEAAVLEKAKETASYYRHGPKIWDARDAVLRLDAPAHVYDMRLGRYLGHVAECGFALRPGRPELFALLPYRVDGLEVNAPASARPGEKIEVTLRLRTSGDAEPGRHVVNVTLTPPDGVQLPTDRYNVEVGQGGGILRVQIPFNAEPGAWRIEARDAVSGVSRTAQLQVGEGAPLPGRPYSLRKPVVEPHAQPWPEGHRVSHAEIKKQAEAQQAGKVAVTGAKLGTFALTRNMGRYQHQKGLRADFTLRNAEAFYRMKYEACNDAEANAWDDPRRIWAHYPPGLGILRPDPMAWFGNGYLQIWLDDFFAGDYAIRSIDEVEVGKNGRVDVTFDTPRGVLILSFAMMPDHPGLFQQLEIRPTVPVQQVKLVFRRYGWGGRDRPHSFIEIDPEERSWALTGDRHDDPAFGKGPGAAAMLIVPEQWDHVDFKPPFPTFSKQVDLAPGDRYKTQWALWIFPEMGNDAAHNYLRDHSAPTRARLETLFR